MSKAFSDEPLTVNGVTVTPTWPWSTQYRAEIAENMRQNVQSDLSPEETERRYIAWYADRHGLSLQQAREKIGRAP